MDLVETYAFRSCSLAAICGDEIRLHHCQNRLRPTDDPRRRANNGLWYLNLCSSYRSLFAALFLQG